MAGLNWNLAPRGVDALQILQDAGKLSQQRVQAEQQQQQIQTRQYAQQQAQAGDYAGGAKAAAIGGDFEYADALNKLDAQGQARLAREFDVIGNLYPTVKALPIEQRAAHAIPILKQAGFSDGELANIQWDDASVDGFYQLSAAGKKALEAKAAAQAKLLEPYSLSRGEQRFVGGNLLAQNDTPPPADYQFDSESGSWLQKPGTGGAPNIAGPQAGYAPQRQADVGGGARYTGGWTPRARNGGDNTDAAVDNKMAGMTRALGVGVDQPFPPGMTASQIYEALTLSEGGRGSLADRNNNRGNLTVPGGGYRKFADKASGDAAAIAQVQRNLARGQNTIRSMVEGRPVGGGRGAAPQQPGPQNPAVINVRPPKQRDAPSGYRWSSDGSQLEAIPGGPGDAKYGAGNRKAEADYRREFDALPEVKTFKTARQQFNALRDTALNPKASASDDIAVIFQFMKSLDPTSTVREGEFATAQNATGVPDAVRNAWNKAQNGQRLNPEQRKAMVQTAYRSYKTYRDAYNQAAENYRGYARDNGVNPDRVARTYTPDPAPQVRRVRTPQEAAALPPGTVFMTPDGRRKVR